MRVLRDAEITIHNSPRRIKLRNYKPVTQPALLSDLSKTSGRNSAVGTWLVQPNLNNVSHNGTMVRLEPKLMGVLVFLASQPGEPVFKEAILKAVWPVVF